MWWWVESWGKGGVLGWCDDKDGGVDYDGQVIIER